MPFLLHRRCQRRQGRCFQACILMDEPISCQNTCLCPFLYSLCNSPPAIRGDILKMLLMKETTTTITELTTQRPIFYLLILSYRHRAEHCCIGLHGACPIRTRQQTLQEMDPVGGQFQSHPKGCTVLYQFDQFVWSRVTGGLDETKSGLLSQVTSVFDERKKGVTGHETQEMPVTSCTAPFVRSSMSIKIFVHIQVINLPLCRIQGVLRRRPSEHRLSLVTNSPLSAVHGSPLNTRKDLESQSDSSPGRSKVVYGRCTKVG